MGRTRCLSNLHHHSRKFDGSGKKSRTRFSPLEWKDAKSIHNAPVCIYHFFDFSLPKMLDFSDTSVLVIQAGGREHYRAGDE